MSTNAINTFNQYSLHIRETFRQIVLYQLVQKHVISVKAVGFSQQLDSSFDEGQFPLRAHAQEKCRHRGQINNSSGATDLFIPDKRCVHWDHERSQWTHERYTRSSDLVYLSLSVFYHEFHLQPATHHPLWLWPLAFQSFPHMVPLCAAKERVFKAAKCVGLFCQGGGKICILSFYSFHSCVTVHVYIRSLSLIRVYFMWFTSHYGMGRNIMPEMFGTVIHLIWEVKEKTVHICTLCSVDNSWTWGFYCFSFLLFMISLQLHRVMNKR